MVQSNKGSIALAHNGNLVNAQEIRPRLEAQGSIFQTTSDTEVIVHLIALSREQTLPEAMADALAAGGRRVLAGDDQSRTGSLQRAIRAASGRWPWDAFRRCRGVKQDTIVFASETCAFDLIGATYERDVKPGELVIVGPEGSHFAVLFARAAAVELHLRACLFFAS